MYRQALPHRCLLAKIASQAHCSPSVIALDWHAVARQTHRTKILMTAGSGSGSLEYLEARQGRSP